MSVRDARNYARTKGLLGTFRAHSLSLGQWRTFYPGYGAVHIVPVNRVQRVVMAAKTGGSRRERRQEEGAGHRVWKRSWGTLIPAAALVQ